MVFEYYLENCLSQSFIFYMMFGLCDNKSPGVFKFTKPKVKVTWVTCDQLCKQFSTEHLKNY